MQPGGPSWPQVSGRSPCGAPVTVLFSSTSLSFPAHVPHPPPSPMRAQSGDPRTAARQPTLWIFPGKILQWVAISFFTLL